MPAMPPDLADRPVPPHLAFLRRHIWIIAAVLGVVTLTALRPLLRHVPEPPPVMFELPDFELVRQDGTPFRRSDLEGHVWVVSFFFTSCPSTCPKVTAAMKSLAERYEAHGLPVRLLSVSVDPKRDTPEVLARYAETIGADPERWTFVTGAEADVRALLEQGFRLGVGDRAEQPDGRYDIAHSTKVALVGPRGGVRGYYGIDELGLDEVFHRSQHVLREARRDGLVPAQ
ncbi:MAG: SCO family protein [Deltaproteobacteria bacterium]|nr:MAG: SCO family protein [Deltaproteobacteria bacterium]